MGFLQRFMYARYGTDQLNIALIVTYLILYLLSFFIWPTLLSLLGAACLFFSLFRMLSRNTAKRRAENLKFLELIQPVTHWYNVRKCRRQDKEHCYFKCPSCGQQLRVPKGKGRISITCRNCGASFEKKT